MCIRDRDTPIAIHSENLYINTVHVYIAPLLYICLLYTSLKLCQKIQIHIFSCIINLQDMVLHCTASALDQSEAKGENQQKGNHALNLFRMLAFNFSILYDNLEVQIYGKTRNRSENHSNP